MNRQIFVPSLRGALQGRRSNPRLRDCFALLAMTFILVLFLGSGMATAAPAKGVTDEEALKNLDDSEQNRRIDELERSLDNLEQKIDRLDDEVEEMDHSLKELKRKV